LSFLLPESRLAVVAHNPTGRSPDEHGFLVMGWSMRAVKALAHTFRQNAVLWMGKDAVPKLVLLYGQKETLPRGKLLGAMLWRL
jgi:hypothetical protein